eukprot:gb/GECG01014184.1/.p1 GENE.gb/GECG01014184.1/~~gb/GECG01014184.1/.p1  ORF type:complete len:1170 (+),score=113.19 gb/GECG01014184.1/:1-3510(+)
MEGSSRRKRRANRNSRPSWGEAARNTHSSFHYSQSSQLSSDKTGDSLHHTATSTHAREWTPTEENRRENGRGIAGTTTPVFEVPSPHTIDEAYNMTWSTTSEGDAFATDSPTGFAQEGTGNRECRENIPADGRNPRQQLHGQSKLRRPRSRQDLNQLNQHPENDMSSSVGTHHASRRQHRQKRQQKKRMAVAEIIVKFLDWLVIVTSELLKAFLKELRILINKISDGVAASLLHVTVRPGYISGRRKRITSSNGPNAAVSRRHTSSGGISGESDDHPSSSTASNGASQDRRQRPGGVRPFQDFLQERFQSIWSPRRDQHNREQSQLRTNSSGGSDSGRNSGSDSERQGRRKTSGKKHGFITSILRRIEGIHQLLVPTLPTVSDVWEKVFSCCRRKQDVTDPDPMADKESVGKGGSSSESAAEKQSRIQSILSISNGTDAHLSKSISYSPGLMEDMSMKLHVWIDQAGTFLRRSYRSFFRRHFGIHRPTRHVIEHEPTVVSHLFLWPFSWFHFLAKLLFLGMRVVWDLIRKFTIMFLSYAKPGNIISAFKISWNTLVSEPMKLIFREIIGRILWDAPVKRIRAKAVEIAPNLTAGEDIKASDLPSSTDGPFNVPEASTSDVPTPVSDGDTKVPPSLRGSAVRLIEEVYGFPVETYGVKTVDGYLLRLIRIPRRESSKVAFFQHGLLDTATAWVANGHLFSLACRAYQMGFDVFLSNLRGTTDLMQHEMNGEMIHDGVMDHDDASRSRGRVKSDGGTASRAVARHGAHTAAIPAHSKLSVLNREFWSFSVDDHTLDVFALTDKMHEIKYGERREWKYKHNQPRQRSVNRLSVVGIGHSMGGAILIGAILHSRALQREHGFSKLVLLSPAAYHKYIAPPAKIIVKFCHWLLRFGSDGPFPLRSSYLESGLAKLLQDLKRTQATSDALATLMSTFFGGTDQDMPFRHVHLTEYPLGGSSRRVFLQGIHCMQEKDYCPYDFGKEENVKRYGTTSTPSYREDYGLIDIPVHFVGGARDYLIPAENLMVQRDAINLIHPGRSSLRIFEEAGHLDFTLGLDDGIIDHVLKEIDTFPRRHADRSVTAVSEGEKSRRLDQLSSATTKEDVAAIVNFGMDKTHAVSQSSWRSAKECSKDYPWLCSYTKLEEAFLGLDNIAQGTHIFEAYAENLRTTGPVQ